MKNKILFFSLFILLCNTGLICQHYLNFKGNITTRDSFPLKKAKLEIFKSDSLVLITVLTNDSGNYHFALPLDSPDDYLVKVTYPKYVHKFFTISTKGISKKSLEIPFPVIEANLCLFEPVPGVDYSLLDTPLNKYYYNPGKDNYAYDKMHLDSTLMKLELLALTEEKVKQENKLAGLHLKKEQITKDFLIIITSILALIIIVVLFVFIKQRTQAKNDQA